MKRAGYPICFHRFPYVSPGTVMIFRTGRPLHRAYPRGSAACGFFMERRLTNAQM